MYRRLNTEGHCVSWVMYAGDISWEKMGSSSKLDKFSPYCLRARKVSLFHCCGVWPRHFQEVGQPFWHMSRETELALPLPRVKTLASCFPRLFVGALPPRNETQFFRILFASLSSTLQRVPTLSPCPVTSLCPIPLFLSLISSLPSFIILPISVIVPGCLLLLLKSVPPSFTHPVLFLPLSSLLLLASACL